MSGTTSTSTNGQTTGQANGSTNANHDGFTSVKSTHNPHPSHKSPYQPVGDFLSNVSRFKIIGMLRPLSRAQSRGNALSAVEADCNHDCYARC